MVTLVGGEQVPTTDEHVARQLYQDIVDNDDRGVTTKVTATVLSVAGKKVVTA